MISVTESCDGGRATQYVFLGPAPWTVSCIYANRLVIVIIVISCYW